MADRQTNETDRLQEMLHQDLGEGDEARELSSTVQQLGRWPAPTPTPQETARLIEALRPVLPEQTVRKPGWWCSTFCSLGAGWPWLLLRAQAKVVRGEIWAASALVIALGTLTTLLADGEASSVSTLPLVLIAPVVAAVGISFLYGAESDPALELELATPTSPRLVLLARLVLVYGFDLGLGLMGSVTLAALMPELSLWPLVTTWLAPMSALSALAFLLTVLSTDATLGTLTSLGLWGLQSVLRIVDPAFLYLRLPDLTAPAARPWLWAAALGLGGLALWAGGHEERWLGGRA
jgi:hypothetical protein